MKVGPAWERHAQEWVRWARKPGHDMFWSTTLPALRELLPSPAGLTIDLGCGEGRFSRELQVLGHHVIGVEAAPTLARAAATHAAPVTVVQADAAALPLADSCADLVTASMVFQNVDDLPGAFAECARVLRAGGHLVGVIVHPFRQVSVVDGQYLQAQPFVYPTRRDGLTMTFTDHHRPISAYLNGLAQAGFVLEHLTEVGEPDDGLPILLGWRCRTTHNGPPVDATRLQPQPA